MYQKKYAWTPQLGTQTQAITATWCEEIFFGGARGGGKTSYLLGDYAQGVNRWGKYWKGILFRKTYKELENVLEQSREIYPLMGGVYRTGNSIWEFPNGATLKLRSMEKDIDASKYQGHEYPWIGFDELPNWATSKPYDKLQACLRSTSNVDCKRIRSTGNPGGVGHSWVKNMFIDPDPDGFKPIDTTHYINLSTGVVVEEEPESMIGWEEHTTTRMFIPSKITDNLILRKKDPGYIARLALTGSKELVKAWIAGDWNAIEGAYFDDWKQDKHVIEDFEIPNHWYRLRSMDWGYGKPFSIHWWAISDGSSVMYKGERRTFPEGAMIGYREWYGMVENKPNVGLRLDSEDIAKGILKREAEEMHDMVLDPACWDASRGVSIAEQMADNGAYWTMADNKRIPGWQQVRYRMKKDLLFIMKQCKHLIRTIPIMQHKVSHFEDLDTDLEDHAVDDMRYACMSRPISIQCAEEEEPRAFPTGKEMLEQALKENRRGR